MGGRWAAGGRLAAGHWGMGRSYDGGRAVHGRG